jgi:hypothetical protein
MIMSQELSPLTLGELCAKDHSTDFADNLAEKIRGLNQAVKNAAIVPASSQEPDWSIRIPDILDPNYGTITTASGATGSIGSIGLQPGFTYATNTTTSPYGIGSGYGGQGNVSIANTQFEQSGKMVIKGKNADIEINGKSMTAWMEKVEQRLNILSPNPDMEKEWDDLRRLGERYRKLEKKCQEKSQMWEALKKMKPPKV